MTGKKRKKKNQHYLPQYYFRFFSRDRKRIQLLRVRAGQVVRDAAIKNQCSKSYFYGDEGAEDVITDLESVYRPALSILKRQRRLVGDRHTLMGALLFQKTRSHLERERPRDAFNKMMRVALEVEANKLDDPDKKALIRDNLDAVEFNPRQFHAMTMSRALLGAPQIVDLELTLLENATARPFIFSDAPVVFFNEASAHIDYRGSYGVACSGLQILCPIDPNLLLFAFDSTHYELTGIEQGRIVISEGSDVDALNTLQLHSSLATVYFDNFNDRDYVSDLWSQERDRLAVPESKVQTAPLVRPGAEEDSELMHIYDPPLNVRLNLSFMKTNPVEDNGQVSLRDAARSHQLARDLEAYIDYLEQSGTAR